MQQQTTAWQAHLRKVHLFILAAPEKHDRCNVLCMLCFGQANADPTTQLLLLHNAPALELCCMINGVWRIHLQRQYFIPCRQQSSKSTTRNNSETGCPAA